MYEDDVLGKPFDVVVLGTGLAESMAAAALSQAGKRVLHLDKAEYYGGDYASLSVEQFVAWQAEHAPGAVAAPAPPPDPRFSFGEPEPEVTWTAESARAALLAAVEGDAAREAREAAAAAEAKAAEAEAAAAAMPATDDASADPATAAAAAAAEAGVEATGAAEAETEADTGAKESSADAEAADPGAASSASSAGGDEDSAASEGAAAAADSEANGSATTAAAAASAAQPVPDRVHLAGVGGSTATFTFTAVPPLADAAEAAAAEAGADGPDTAAGRGRSIAAAGRTPPPELVAESRRFMIDITPRLTLCRGAFIDALVRTGLGAYMEFKTLDETHVLISEAGRAGKAMARATSKPGGAGRGGGGGGGGGGDGDAGDRGDAAMRLLCKVPCNKADVFQSSLLSLLEKRVLMKFLQFCNDFGVAAAGSSVTTRNEEGLGASRSLTRPQNKAATSYDYEGYKDRPFRDFLAACKLSPNLQAIIVHAVALAVSPQEGYGADEGHGVGGAGGGTVAAARAHRPTPMSTREGMAAIVRYLNSMGRFGLTAFIVSMYGVSELPQAFCRMCAVHGGVYMLRTFADHLVMADGTGGDGAGTAAGDGGEGPAEDTAGGAGDKDKDGGKGAAGALAPTARCVGVALRNGKIIRTRHVIASPEYLPQACSPTRARIARCVCVTTGSLREGATRLSVVVPPRCAPFGNVNAVQLLQEDWSCQVAPRGHFIVHVSTLVDEAEAAAGAGDGDVSRLPVMAALRRIVEAFTRDKPEGAVAESAAADASAAAEPATAEPAATSGGDAVASDAAAPAGGDGQAEGQTDGKAGDAEAKPAADAGAAAASAVADTDLRPHLLWCAYYLETVRYAAPPATLPPNVLLAAPRLAVDPAFPGVVATPTDAAVDADADADAAGAADTGANGSYRGYVVSTSESPLKLHHGEAVAIARTLFAAVCGDDADFLPERKSPEDEADSDEEVVTATTSTQAGASTSQQEPAAGAADAPGAGESAAAETDSGEAGAVQTSAAGGEVTADAAAAAPEGK